MTALEPLPAESCRKQRGRALAAVVTITQRGKTWYVPSQSSKGTIYQVTLDDVGPICTCPDFQARGQCCKHAYAVEEAIRTSRVRKPDLPAVDSDALWGRFGDPHATTKHENEVSDA